MTATMEVWVQGIGFWAPGLADWPAFVAWTAGAALGDTVRPQADVLPPNERRRAPEAVLLAAAAAGQAVRQSGLDPATLTSLFSSAHGDQGIMDYMCATLATAPAELSPIRFHNSVHNAAAGYWTIATGCHAPSSAVSGGDYSFGAGLLEAAVQAVADQRPVLLATFDTAGYGPLRTMTHSTAAFASALVLTPAATTTSLARLSITPEALGPATIPADPRIVAWMDDNPAAAAAPLLLGLARGDTFHCAVPASAGLQCRLGIEALS
jgi:hypothetical protein